MPVVSLPDEPSLEQLRNQAKDLRRAVLAGQADALAEAAERFPDARAETLLRLGADPDIRDHRFDSTPLGWARHFGQQPLIDLLEPLTAPDPDRAGGPTE